MKQLYSTDNSIEALNYKNIIENENIEVTLKNEHSAGRAAPGLAICLELWVDNPNYEKARGILDSLTTASDNKDWVCKACNETNDASFEICWKCQHAAS